MHRIEPYALLELINSWCHVQLYPLYSKSCNIHQQWMTWKNLLTTYLQTNITLQNSIYRLHLAPHILVLNGRTRWWMMVALLHSPATSSSSVQEERQLQFCIPAVCRKQKQAPSKQAFARCSRKLWSGRQWECQQCQTTMWSAEERQRTRVNFLLQDVPNQPAFTVFGEKCNWHLQNSNYVTLYDVCVCVCVCVRASVEGSTHTYTHTHTISLPPSPPSLSEYELLIISQSNKLCHMSWSFNGK